MPVTALDPRTALVVIDLQTGIKAYATSPIDDVVQQAAALAGAFRGHGLPVVLVNVTGGAQGRTEQARPPLKFPEGFADFLPELNQQPEDHVVTKQTWGAFTGTDLEAYLKGLGVTQIVLAGVATASGVESTARQAYELGFNVTLAIDAMADTRPGAHEHCVSSVFPRLGETGTTRQILDLLDAA